MPPCSSGCAPWPAACAGSASSKGDRVVIYMPMVPEAVIAMLACARIGAIHSVVFGGFAPQELAARIDDAAPEGRAVGVVRRRAEPRRALQAVPRRGASDRSEHQPEHCVVLQREQLPAELGERDIDWAEFESGDAGARGQRVRHGRGDRPALHPLHVRHDREAQGHLPRQRRLRRGAALVDGQPLRRRARRDDVHRERRRLGRRPLLHRLRAAADRARRPCSTRASRSAPPTPGAFWRVIAEYGAVCLFTAPTAFRAIKKEDSTASHGRRPRPVALPGPLPRGGAARPRHLRVGLGRPRQAGHRQLVADRDRLADRLPTPRGSGCCRSSRVTDRRRARATTCRCSTARASRSSRASRARSASSCRCHPARCRRSGATTTATSAPTCRPTRATTSPATAATSTRTATSTSWGAPTTCSTSRGTGSRPGSLEAALAGHEAVAECAVIGVHDDLKGQVPRALVVLKSGIDAEADGERIRRELVARVRAEVGRRRGAAPGRHRRRPAQDALGQDPAQDDARARRRQDARGARDDRGRLGPRRPSRPSCAAPPRPRRSSRPRPSGCRDALDRGSGVRRAAGGGGPRRCESTRWIAALHRPARGQRREGRPHRHPLGPVLPADEHERGRAARRPAA